MRRLYLDRREYIHLLPPKATQGGGALRSQARLPTLAPAPLASHVAHSPLSFYARAHQPVTTLLLWAPHRVACEELEAAVRCALATLKGALGEQVSKLNLETLAIELPGRLTVFQGSKLVITSSDLTEEIGRGEKIKIGGGGSGPNATPEEVFRVSMDSDLPFDETQMPLDREYPAPSRESIRAWRMEPSKTMKKVEERKLALKAKVTAPVANMWLSIAEKVKDATDGRTGKQAMMVNK